MEKLFAIVTTTKDASTIADVKPIDDLPFESKASAVVEPAYTEDQAGEHGAINTSTAATIRNIANNNDDGSSNGNWLNGNKVMSSSNANNKFIGKDSSNCHGLNNNTTHDYKLSSPLAETVLSTATNSPTPTLLTLPRINTVDTSTDITTTTAITAATTAITAATTAITATTPATTTTPATATTDAITATCLTCDALDNSLPSPVACSETFIPALPLLNNEDEFVVSTYTSATTSTTTTTTTASTGSKLLENGSYDEPAVALPRGCSSNSGRAIEGGRGGAPSPWNGIVKSRVSRYCTMPVDIGSANRNRLGKTLLTPQQYMISKLMNDSNIYIRSNDLCGGSVTSNSSSSYNSCVSSVSHAYTQFYSPDSSRKLISESRSPACTATSIDKLMETGRNTDLYDHYEDISSGKAVESCDDILLEGEDEDALSRIKARYRKVSCSILNFCCW